MSELEAFLTGAVVVVVVLAYFGDRFGGPDAEQFQSIDQLTEAYASGEVSESFFEAHANAYVDEETVAFMRELERVPHVGPKTALALAQRWPFEQALRNATREELEEVHGVGPSLSAELKRVYPQPADAMHDRIDRLEDGSSA